jgi:hypothetical protein
VRRLITVKVGKGAREWRCRLAAARNCLRSAAVERGSCCWVLVGGVEVGGEGEVAGEAVMELRLPSSGGLNVSEHVNRGTVQRLASCRQHLLVGVRRLTLELWM